MSVYDNCEACWIRRDLSCSGEIKKTAISSPSPYGYGRADLAAQI